MTLNIDEKGTISLYQGDSGEIVISGLNTDKNYVVYFAIQDKNRKTVGNELSVNSNMSESVVFFLTSDYTDLLKVPSNKLYEIYTYGVKVTVPSDEVEDTLFVANGTYGTQNNIIVYPRKVAGV